MSQAEKLIYHITTRTAWDAAKQTGRYSADSLSSEGFIHASTRTQVLTTAERYYAGQHGLVLLEIDAECIQPEVRYEVSTGGELFPHIYGALNTSAVLRALPFEPQPGGGFAWPEE